MLILIMHLKVVIIIANGFDDSENINLRNKIRGELTQKQLDKAKKLSHKWFRKYQGYGDGFLRY